MRRIQNFSRETDTEEPLVMNVSGSGSGSGRILDLTLYEYYIQGGMRHLLV